MTKFVDIAGGVSLGLTLIGGIGFVVTGDWKWLIIVAINVLNAFLYTAVKDKLDEGK